MIPGPDEFFTATAAIRTVHAAGDGAQALTNGLGRSADAFTSGTSGLAFDPAKLARIEASLQKQGVAFVTGEEGGRLSRALGGEAVYIPEVGRPGIIAWGPQPSRAAVVEELLHLGQHRASGWADLSGRIVELEIQAQSRLLTIGARLGWTQDEIAQILRAQARWMEGR